MSTETLMFVYGTLKRGCSNHAYLIDQKFLGEGRTSPGFQLYDLYGFPGMVVANAPPAEGVSGEVWSIDPATLDQLDRLEGLAEGLYRRERVPLLPPFHDQPVQAYIYARSIAHHRRIGSTWTE